MFFLADELVLEQEKIVQEKLKTGNGRFRKIKTLEKKLASIGDDLIEQPCGPEIMWPNALVLEALLMHGYEYHSRVQTALQRQALSPAS